MYWGRPVRTGYMTGLRDTLPTLTGHSVTWAKPTDGRVRIGIDSPEGATELEADHVIAATGYRVSLDRLTFLSEEVRSRLKTLAGSPVVGADYESSVPGLYFIGMAVAPTFGPVMRFVFGTSAARRSRRLARQRLATDGARRAKSWSAGASRLLRRSRRAGRCRHAAGGDGHYGNWPRTALALRTVPMVLMYHCMAESADDPTGYA